ncbi:MAG TPA: glycosyltransferase family 39 protein [Bacteroidales bacterium]|nr:glycosyltransferase family 39 protein [Bacteroidales bacterium]
MENRVHKFSARIIPAQLWWLVALSAIFRGFLAWWLELGNDEVYYWTYALFPDLSHFDHPPMVGWMIQLFSLNLLFDNELFLRLSSVVLMSANTITVFHIGRMLRNLRTGLIAAFLYNTSIYAFVITGIFILPDTPQNFFWLLALLTLIRLSDCQPDRPGFVRLWLWFGLLAGFAMLSKYTSVFLWVGAAFFTLFYRRDWLRTPWPWAAALISFVVFTPVIIWNIQNGFISFSFHGGRVTPQSGIRLDYFFTELAGQWLYNNPINVWLSWAALLAIFRRRVFADTNSVRVLMFTAMPPILLFLAISFFRATLPHWTGPAYVSLIPLAAARIEARTQKPLIPRSISAAGVLLLLVVLSGAVHIKFGLLQVGKEQPYHRIGKDDPGLDMFGYRDLLPAFSQIRQKHAEAGTIELEAGLAGENWFPLANYDYYIARPLGIKAFGIGQPERLHKYLWINRERGGLRLGADYWYITNSRDYKHPAQVFDGLFADIITADTVTINRSGKPAKRHFVFILKNLQQLPPDPLAK